MKKLIYLGLPFFIFACGGGSEQDLTDKVEETIDSFETMPAEDSEEIVEEVYVPENSDGNWQIDDYAELFVGDKIAMSTEDANLENSVGWYYTTIDKKGGYANVTGAIEGWREFVIWRMADGDDLIGSLSVGCGPVCDYSFKFYKGQGKEVEEIAMTTIMPVAEIEKQKVKIQQKVLNDDKFGPFDYPDDVQLYFHFPQKGTSMDVDIIMGADELQAKILSLKWDKTGFSIDKLHDDIKVRI